MTDEQKKRYSDERAIMNYGIIQACKMIKEGKSVDEVYTLALDKITRCGYMIDEDGYLLNESKEVM